MLLWSNQRKMKSYSYGYTVLILGLHISQVFLAEYRIVGLVPLSGRHADRGRAQYQGMNLGIAEALHKVNDVPNVTATFSFNDTKCDALRENDLILSNYWEKKPHEQLIILGGGCPREESISLGSLRKSILQITFEEASPFTNPATVWPPISVRGSGPSQTNQALAYFILDQHWRHLSVVVDLSSDESSKCFDEISDQLSGLNVSISQRIDYFSLQADSQILKATGARVVLLCLDSQQVSDLVCQQFQDNKHVHKRHIWLVPVSNASEQSRQLESNCPGVHLSLNRTFLFEPQEDLLNSKVSQVFSYIVESDFSLRSNIVLQKEASYSYDATKILLDSLRALGSSQITDNRVFTNKLFDVITDRRWTGVTGIADIENTGQRKNKIFIYSFEDADNKLKLISIDRGMDFTTIDRDMSSDTVDKEVRLDGVPMSLFVVMCALATLGVIYSIALMVFFIVKRTDKVIKMTSPNINTVILLGCCGAYATLAMLGLDTSKVSTTTMEKLLQGSAYVLVIGFSLIYGAVFAKSWRVFMIFKNLNANGKMTRDEHLLLGVFFMILLDLVILLPWNLLDPIKCYKRTVTTIFEPDRMADITLEIDVCQSQHQVVWISMIYIYKLLLAFLGFFFSYQTRHVTLPALRDTRMIYTTICLVLTLAIVALPILMIEAIGGKISFAVGGLVIWLTITISITLLFLPKVFLYKKESNRNSHGESFRFQYSESMKRTREALRKLSGCLCCGSGGEDKYAQEVLVTEIETLKRTIKDKDVTIRELNDRLYVGADKFQEYLRSAHRHQDTLAAMQKKHNSRSKSQTVFGAEQEQEYIQQSPSSPDSGLSKSTPDNLYQHGISPEEHRYVQRERRPSGYSQDYYLSDNTSAKDISVYTIDSPERPDHIIQAPVAVHTPHHTTRVPSISYTTDNYKQVNTPSPNFDSAIDNNSPSSSSSDGSIPDSRWQKQNNAHSSHDLRPQDVRQDGIDLEAIEQEAASSPRYWIEETPTPHRQIPSRQIREPVPHKLDTIYTDHGMESAPIRYKTRHQTQDLPSRTNHHTQATSYRNPTTVHKYKVMPPRNNTDNGRNSYNGHSSHNKVPYQSRTIESMVSVSQI